MPGTTQRQAGGGVSASSGPARAMAATTPVNQWGGDTRTVGMSLVIGRALGTVVVTLRGELDGSGSAYLAGILNDLIDGQGNLDVGVDLHSVGSIDCASVEALAVAGHQLARHGGQLSLARPIPAVREVLAATGLAGLIVDPQPPKARVPSGGGNRPTPRRACTPLEAATTTSSPTRHPTKETRID